MKAVRFILFLHLLLGVWLGILGLVAHVRPHMLLDVVLTQDELRDWDKLDATLELMQKGAGSDSLWLLLSGVFLVCTSVVARAKLKPLLASERA
jgi:hypothetical protein